MNIYHKFARITATAGVLLSLGFVNVRKAEAIAFNMDWTGQTLGYEGKGNFSYDETKVPTDGIVRKNDLESFDISFSDLNGNLIAKFEDDHLSEGFNFNFDTATGKILQSGLWDAPDGISLGEPREQGLNFWSVPGALFDDDSELPPSPNPHVHLTDWLGEYPDLPQGFRRHLDVAFFSVTTEELLDDPTAGDEVGQRLVATKIPEPTSVLGVGIVGLALLVYQRKTNFSKS